MSIHTRCFSIVITAAIALIAPAVHGTSAASAQGLAVSITVAPPPLPVYAQPVIPGAGYLWTPGYWAWGPGGYYWVPGTWVRPPAVGLLWTPGYWGWVNGGYFWHAGYWGPHIGFYGGINYGFGYTGVGFFGGRWTGGHFFYNRSANNFGGVHITNVYNAPINNAAVTHVSFNGGQGGTSATPNAAEQAAANEHHFNPTTAQTAHQQAAGQNHALLASVNHGRPAVAATSHAGTFNGPGVVRARAPGNGPGAQPHPAQHQSVQHQQPQGQRQPGERQPPQHQPPGEQGRPNEGGPNDRRQNQ